MENVSKHFGPTLGASYQARLVLVLAALVTVLFWMSAGTGAHAKGPVNIEVCGEDGCITKKSSRFGAAMLYGGRGHSAPNCGAPFHRAAIRFPGYPGGSPRVDRYLLVASRGLIGLRVKNGYVWWRKVGGWKKRALVWASMRAGKGFAAVLDLPLSEFEFGFSALPDRFYVALNESGKSGIEPWRLTAEGASCRPAGSI